MPIVDVRCATGALDKAAKASLAERLIEVLIKMEGGANTHKGRAFAWVLFTEVAEPGTRASARTAPLLQP